MTPTKYQRNLSGAQVLRNRRNYQIERNLRITAFIVLASIAAIVAVAAML